MSKTLKYLLAAFSLIELLIVIAIIGIITTIAIPSYKQYVIKAKMLEFFNLAEQHKLKLIEKITISEQQENINSVINNPSRFIEKLEYIINIDNKKYILKFTANMQHLGISLINGSPLIMQFIGEEDLTNDAIVWHCKYNKGFGDFVPKICQEAD